MEEETWQCVVCWEDVTADEVRNAGVVCCVLLLFSLAASQPETECFYVDGSHRKRSVYCWGCAMEVATQHFVRWKLKVDEVDCASALRRLIAKGPPMSFVEVDVSVATADTTPIALGATLVRGDLTDSRSSLLDGAPRTVEERDKLWAKLREREAELPENAAPDTAADTPTAASGTPTNESE